MYSVNKSIQYHNYSIKWFRSTKNINTMYTNMVYNTKHKCHLTWVVLVFYCLSLIGRGFEAIGSIWTLYNIPPSEFSPFYILKVPDVGVLVWTKSAGLDKSCDVSFRLFHMSPALFKFLFSYSICIVHFPSCSMLFKFRYLKRINFYNLLPPYLLGFMVRQSYFFWLLCCLFCYHLYLSHRPCEGVVHLRGRLWLVGSRFSRSIVVFKITLTVLNFSFSTSRLPIFSLPLVLLVGFRTIGWDVLAAAPQTVSVLRSYEVSYFRCLLHLSFFSER